MKTFLNNLSNKMKKSKAWRFLIGSPVKELPDKFTKMHKEYLKKEELTGTIDFRKKKKSKKRHFENPIPKHEFVDLVAPLTETKPSKTIIKNQLLLPENVIDDIPIQIQETTKKYKNE